MLKDKRVLITGGGGFIGSSLAERLADQNQLILLDVGFENNAFRFSNLNGNGNINLVEGSVLDYDRMLLLVRDVDIVVHAAAILSVSRVIQDPHLTLDTNYIGASNLLKASSANSHLPKFILFSTSEVFGVNAFRVKEEAPMTLPSVEGARWCYSISKLASEQLALGYYYKTGLPVVLVRPFNVFGPKRVGDHVILRFIHNALRGEDLVVHGDGSQIRSWCYVDDFLSALINAMDKDSAVGHAFNIGNPLNTLSIYQLARLVIRLASSPSNIVFKHPDFTDIDIRIPDIEKAARLLDFTPEVEIEQGLQRTIDWYREHLNELEPLLQHMETSE